MEGSEDWMMQVVEAGLMPYSALDDPARDLSDFVFCLEYLDVKHENLRRAKAQGGRNG